MKLSKLQKYIILQCYSSNGKTRRGSLVNFYGKAKSSAKKEFWVKIITKSIERLIDKELVVGYGIRTTHKWFIKEIKLTAKGKKIAKELLGKQQSLPLRIKNK